MKKVYCHSDRFMVWQMKQRLDGLGIPCFIKNEFAIGAVGELSPFDVLPEVWISDNEWLPRTLKLIAEFEQQSMPTEAWHCSVCNEQNAASFELCWHCGQDPQLSEQD